MLVELKVLHTEGAGRKVMAAAGQSVQVGRLLGLNQLAVPDPLLAPVHFSLSYDGNEARVTDLNLKVQMHRACATECFTQSLRNTRCSDMCRLNNRSPGVGMYLNGVKVTEAVVRDGDVLVAGSSYFTITFLEAAPEPASSDAREYALTPEQRAHAVELLASQKLPLFALVDAARAPELLQILRMHGEVYYSLYDGPAGEKLDHVAPYLVQLHARSPLVGALVSEQWGNSWGMFLWALADFKTLRRHLRRFLMVEGPSGKELYFRFYDPRVLRIFLPTCTAQEATDFFGPIHCFLMEAAEPAKAWACSLQPGTLMRVDTIAL